MSSETMVLHAGRSTPRAFENASVTLQLLCIIRHTWYVILSYDLQNVEVPCRQNISDVFPVFVLGEGQRKVCSTFTLEIQPDTTGC